MVLQSLTEKQAKELREMKEGRNVLQNINNRFGSLYYSVFVGQLSCSTSDFLLNHIFSGKDKLKKSKHHLRLANHGLYMQPINI